MAYLEGVDDASLDHVLIVSSGRIVAKGGSCAVSLCALEQLANDDSALHACKQRGSHSQVWAGKGRGRQAACCGMTLVLYGTTWEAESQHLHLQPSAVKLCPRWAAYIQTTGI